MVSLPEYLCQWTRETFASLTKRVSGPEAYCGYYDSARPWVGVVSDSSDYAAGFFVGTFVRSWSWREQEADWGIYSKELSAALQALSAALDLYPGHNVHMYIDNTAVIHTLAHWYSRVHFWNPYLLSMHGKLRESHTTVVQEYVHTSANRGIGPM